MGTITVNSDYYAIWGRNPEPKEIAIGDIQEGFNFANVIGIRIAEGATLNDSSLSLGFKNPKYDGDGGAVSQPDYNTVFEISKSYRGAYYYSIKVRGNGQTIIVENGTVTDPSTVVFNDEAVALIQKIGSDWYLHNNTGSDTDYNTFKEAIIFTYYDI